MLIGHGLFRFGIMVINHNAAGRFSLPKNTWGERSG